MESKKRMKVANFWLVWCSALMNYLVLHYGVKHGIAICIFWDVFALMCMAFRWNWTSKWCYGSAYQVFVSNIAVFFIEKHWGAVLFWAGVVAYIAVSTWGYSEIALVVCSFTYAILIWLRKHLWPLHCLFANILYGLGNWT